MDPALIAEYKRTIIAGVLVKQISHSALVESLKDLVEDEQYRMHCRMVCAIEKGNHLEVLRLAGSFEFETDNDKYVAMVLLECACQIIMNQKTNKKSSNSRYAHQPRKMKLLPREARKLCSDFFYKNNGQCSDEFLKMVVEQYGVDPKQVTMYFSQKRKREKRFR